MKTILIILCVLIGISLLGLLAPAIGAALLAWLFFACDFTALGVLSVIGGIIAEIVWIYSLFAGSSGPAGGDSTYDTDDAEFEDTGNKFNWPMMIGLTFLVDKMEHKNNKGRHV